MTNPVPLCFPDADGLSVVPEEGSLEMKIQVKWTHSLR